MKTSSVQFSIQSGVARITLDRPNRLNAFTADLHADVRAVLSAIEADGDCRVLVITGAGRAFCFGQDLDQRMRSGEGGPAVDLGQTLARDMNPLVTRLAALPFPVIAAVNGTAAGAGVSLALAADLVIAARSAAFSFSGCRVGLIPDGGVTWALPRLVGAARAAGLVLLGETLSAQDAAAAGLIWKAVDDAELPAEVQRLVDVLTSQPTAALAAAKQALRRSWSNSLEQQLELERILQRAPFATAIATPPPLSAEQFNEAAWLGDDLPLEAALAQEPGSWWLTSGSPDQREGKATILEKPNPSSNGE